MSYEPIPPGPPQIARTAAPTFLPSHEDPPANDSSEHESFVQALTLRAMGVPIAVIGTVAMWEILRLRFNVRIGVGLPVEQDQMPSTGAVLATFGELLSDGYRNASLSSHFITTLLFLLSVFIPAVVVGGAAGAAIGSSRVVRGLLDPFLSLQSFMAPVVLTSLTVFIAGLGRSGQRWALVVPATFICASGVARAVSKENVPTADGVIWAIRTTLVVAFVGAGIAEVVGPSGGLYAMGFQARNFSQRDVVMVVLILAAAMGFTLDTIIRLLGKAVEWASANR